MTEPTIATRARYYFLNFLKRRFDVLIAIVLVIAVLVTSSRMMSHNAQIVSDSILSDAAQNSCLRERILQSTRPVTNRLLSNFKDYCKHVEAENRKFEILQNQKDAVKNMKTTLE